MQKQIICRLIVIHDQNNHDQNTTTDKVHANNNTRMKHSHESEDVGTSSHYITTLIEK